MNIFPKMSHKYGGGDTCFHTFMYLNTTSLTYSKEMKE